MTQNNISKYIVWTSLCLFTALFFFEFTQADVIIQNYFFDPLTQTWLVDKNNTFLRFIFYSGIKKLLIVFGVGLLITLLFFRKTFFVQTYKKGLLLVVLSALAIPLVVGSVKAMTNAPCPCDMKIYNGIYPSVKVFEKYPEDFEEMQPIRCWPAGHASGGFALMAFFFFFKTAKNQKRALFFALIIGWSMGGYKMLIGHHFLSHTIITMLIAWLIILILAKFLKINASLA
ncbi:MAG: phosphatase PAP2 family protein [Sulfurimonadaceae bacterium]|jgi:membrane-associated PAP2 superfamily phosphatase|nr:phosphatase PAP2 family protein [Sulfurimonadaceae bacterium]